MARLAAILIALVALALPAAAQQEEIVAGLSQNRVAITATFVGSEILIFGAVKREAPAPDPPLEVAVVVEGPSLPITVRRKERRFGIWVNAASVRVQAAPSFYAIATSGPLDKVISPEVDHANHISIPESITIMGNQSTPDIQDFARAVIRIRKASGLYQIEEGAVKIARNTLFDTRVKLPSNLTQGVYRARIFLTREGRIVSNYDAYIDVSKVGLERWIYQLAHRNAWVYGLASLAIAIAAGWGASTAFRYLLRR